MRQIRITDFPVLYGWSGHMGWQMGPSEVIEYDHDGD